MSKLLQFPSIKPNLPSIYIDGGRVCDYATDEVFLVEGKIETRLLPHDIDQGMLPGISCLISIRDHDEGDGYLYEFSGSRRLKKYILSLTRTYKAMVEYEEKLV